MAVGLLSHTVSDLCLGKPALRSLPATATLGDALSALRSSGETCLSVWSCDHSSGDAAAPEAELGCRCVGKVCMVDVICYLCEDGRLSSPSSALKAPLTAILPNIPGLVIHVDPSSSLLEAIDLILQGAQNLVVPIVTRFATKTRRKQHQKPSPTPTLHHGREFCWLTQEDVVRFLLNSIGVFSPLPALSIDDLGIVSADVLVADYHSPASSAVGAIASSLADQTSVAVVDGNGVLIGEISPFALASCDETAAAAVATLSCGDLLAYIDCGGPPEELVRTVKARLEERGLQATVNELAISSSNSNPSSPSSDEDTVTSPTSVLLLRKLGRCNSRSFSYSSRLVRRSEAIVCNRKSSLVAVMVQAIAHRVNYVWVIEEDCSLIGIVTFYHMLEVLKEHLENLA
ncbi:CBS domain-containing protein CBSX5-like [Rhodamnia argentea]|uniref:CBS domain-containing protein CBSX5-like n=1 Tax=Rhodamnia argentea TaxID=178133 RepID=A0A8B8MYX8_9MYRT|nr:CBS domain-containing protein CBSX5-like [Rhodamnia argentea]